MRHRHSYNESRPAAEDDRDETGVYVAASGDDTPSSTFAPPNQHEIAHTPGDSPVIAWQQALAHAIGPGVNTNQTHAEHVLGTPGSPVTDWAGHHGAAHAHAADASPSVQAPAPEPVPTTSPVPLPAAPQAPEAPSPVPEAQQGLSLGMNLAGAEFGKNSGGQFGTDYTYPTHGEIDYYASKGFSTIRLPFLIERAQDGVGAPLNAVEMQRMDDVVSCATSHGIKVILDAHNFGSAFGHQIGSTEMPTSAFADFWGKMGHHFADNPNVMFGLMNEPHDQTAQDWLVSSNAAIAAIRDAGADQKILVSGTHWDGAWTWTSSDNASVIGNGTVDPRNNYAFEVHQYLDFDGSGTHREVVSDTIGVERLKDITAWAEASGKELFLGEFAVSQDPQGLHAMDQMLAFMQQHPSAWKGATYWAGGPWWGDYMFSAEPSGGVDKPQVAVMEKYMASSPQVAAPVSSPGTLAAIPSSPTADAMPSPSSPGDILHHTLHLWS